MKVDRWQDYIEKLRLQHRIPAIATGIVRHGELEWFQGFGETELGNQKRPHENSSFRVASNTKTVTAASLMLLEEASMLSMHDPVMLHIPEATAINPTHGDLEDITLKRLATHYSGLATEHPATDWASPDFPTSETILERLAELEVVIPPDFQWKYSNVAYALLGEVITRLSGKKYRQFAMSELLEPLGMLNTVFDPNAVAVSDRVVGYSHPAPGDEELRIAPYADLNGLDSAGQLMTSVADLAKWIAFHMDESDAQKDNSVLSVNGRQQLMHPAYMDRDWTSGQCIGWRANRYGDNVYLGHGGGIHGFGTQTMFHRSSNTGVVILTNLWPNTVSVQLATDLLDMTVRDLDEPHKHTPAAPPSRPYPPSDASSSLHKFTGDYFAEPGFQLQVHAISDERVHLCIDDASEYVLHAPADALLVDGTSLSFRVESGRAAGETISFEDDQFWLGGFKYRRIN